MITEANKVEIAHIDELLHGQLELLAASQKSLINIISYIRPRMEALVEGGISLDELALELKVGRSFLEQIVDSEGEPQITLQWR